MFRIEIDPESGATRGPLAHVLLPGSGPSRERDIVMDDAGEVTLVMSSLVGVWNGRGLRALDVRRDGYRGTPIRATVSPDGLLAVASCCDAEIDFIRRAESLSSKPRRTGFRSVPALRGGLSLALGWSDDASVWALSGPDGGLVLVRPDAPPVVVGQVGTTIHSSLTVATGLMTSDRPTISRPEPTWPSSPGERVGLVVAIVVAGGLLVAIGFGAIRRSVRRRTQRLSAPADEA